MVRRPARGSSRRPASERVATSVKYTTCLIRTWPRRSPTLFSAAFRSRERLPLSNRIPEWMRIDGGRAAFSKPRGLAPPATCRKSARGCPQERLCESMCTLNERTEAVSIGAIEKFIQEYAFAHGDVEVHRVFPNGFRVAVVGSGPAGLACADELIQRGYEITVLESLPVLGGLLVNGIPAFKLDKSVVERRINLLRQRGVVFHTEVHVGRDLKLNELRRDYDAVFLGWGREIEELGVPGEELKGVYQGLPFLIEKNVGRQRNSTPSRSGQTRRGARRRGQRDGLPAHRHSPNAWRPSAFTGGISTICRAAAAISERDCGRRSVQLPTNPVALEGDEEGHETSPVRAHETGRPRLQRPPQTGPRARFEFVVPTWCSSPLALIRSRSIRTANGAESRSTSGTASSSMRTK